jgi:acyl-CoA oxidase
MTSQSQQQSDMQQCRAANSLNVDSLTDMLYRGFRDKQTRNKIRQSIQNEPAFDKTKRPFQSRNQRMTSSIYALRRLLELKHEQQWSVSSSKIQDCHRSTG